METKEEAFIRIMGNLGAEFIDCGEGDEPPKAVLTCQHPRSSQFTINTGKKVNTRKKEIIKGWVLFTYRCKSVSGKTEEWFVKHKDTGFMLGYIRWYPGWRQYVFHVTHETNEINETNDTFFSSGCLHDIGLFIDKLMEERNIAKKKNSKK